MSLKDNARQLVAGTRVSAGMGLALNLGGVARVELNYCLPLKAQASDRFGGVAFVLRLIFVEFSVGIFLTFMFVYVLYFPIVRPHLCFTLLHPACVTSKYFIALLYLSYTQSPSIL